MLFEGLWSFHFRAFYFGSRSQKTSEAACKDQRQSCGFFDERQTRMPVLLTIRDLGIDQVGQHGQ